MTGRTAVARESPAARERSGSGPEPEPVTRRRTGWRGPAELVAAGAVAVLVSVAVAATVDRLPIPAGSNVGLALTATGGLLVAGILAAAGLVHRRHPALTAPLAWIGLSALSTVPLSLLLANTRHYLFGISGDQAFRVQYLTRFADSARPADVAYADLPPFYPQAWFWVGGRLADLFGVEAWAFYKPFAVTTMALTGVLAFVLWSTVVSRPRALGLATVTTLVGLALAAYTPYSWLTAALVAPVAVLGVRLVDPARPHRRAWVGGAVTIGLVLALAGVTHTQICVFAALVLLVVVVDAALRGRSQGRPHAVHLLRAAAVVVVVALPLLLLNWAPYLLARLRVQGPGAVVDAAQRFLPQSGATYPLPMLEPTVLGVLALAGTVWIVLRSGRDPVARALGWTVVCGYAWYLLSTLALVADTTLLSFRIEPIIAAALACGAVGLAADGVRAARSRLGDGYWRPTVSRMPALLAVLAAAVVVAQVQTTPETYSWSTAAQNGDYYPDGTKPTGARADTDAGAWNAELASTIDQLTGRPADQVVVQSSTYALLSYHPYRAYQTTVVQYANPLADFAGRRDRLLEWSRSTSPAELLARLDASPVRAPSVFVFGRGPDGLLSQGLTYDPFPGQGTGGGTAVFDPRLFDDPAFVRRDVGPFTVVVRPDVPPVVG